MFLPFWVLPLISAATWLGMLLAMLAVWTAQGHPHYVSMVPRQRIAYISDIGASPIKPLFVAGCCVTTVSLDLAFLSEIWLRHKAFLAPNLKTSEKALSVLSTVFATLGTFGLILLSVFDTVHHPKVHRLFLLLFMLGYVVSAIFVCWEYQRLGVRFREYRVLRVSFWLKLVFIIVESFLAIGFGFCLFKRRQNPGAILEWIISFVFTFYILTFLIDLFPVVRTKNGQHRTGNQLEGGLAGSPEEHEISRLNGQSSSSRDECESGPPVVT
jgi:hypothetical protein